MSKIQETQEIVPYSCKPRSPRRVLSNSGSKWMIKAKLSVGEHGEQIAEPGEKVDLNAYIQASKASTDIATIVARYKAGDESVLNVNPNGFYGDVSIIPSTINDVVKINQMYDKAKGSFSSLPEEIRALFASEEEFFNGVLDGSATAKIKGYYDAQKQAPQAEPEEGEKQ